MKRFLIALAAGAAISVAALTGGSVASADHGSCDSKASIPVVDGLSAVDAAVVIAAYQRDMTANARSGLANYTFEGGICSQEELYERAHVVGKAIAIYALLSEPSGITVNASPYPCAGATMGTKVTGYTAGHLDAGGLFIGWPTWDADWFSAGDVLPNQTCPLDKRISDIKKAVEQTYFNVTGQVIDFDTFDIPYEPAWPDSFYVED